MGVLSASLARPSLQVLKLAPAFLWEPVDVFKIMEFVTLAVKPLDDGLALEIARVLSEKPGLFSDNWFAAVLGYLDSGAGSSEARKQYSFWFDRRRYRADATAPKSEAIALYAYLHEWARGYFEQTGGKNTSLLVLAEQARRIRDLLEALPEQRLRFLELERIVRTIYEPSPVQFAPAEQGAFSYFHQPGAMAAGADALIWWNCLYENDSPPPDAWSPAERTWLESRQMAPEDPKRYSERRLFQRQRPVLQTRERLLLVVPDQADGAEASPSLLLSDVEAAFDACHKFIYNIDNESDRENLRQLFHLPDTEILEGRTLLRPRPHLQINIPDAVLQTEYETPTGLDSLFYYPHRWFFRHRLRLFPLSLLSVTGDQTLLGNLAHRFFEDLLQQDLHGWDRKNIHDWINVKADTLLEREGATLLLYGREPERQAFLTRMKNAAWSLVSMLRNNGWIVLGTEKELKGALGDRPVQGKADLVLQRGDERAIVDLKWSGARRRREMIRNGEDLQLVLYARLLEPAEQWAHTAYFIIDEGKMIARNNAAFREAMIAGQGEDHLAAYARTLDKMELTFAWRLQQLRQGLLEIRTARTAAELEDLYGAELLELLEMKNEDARWDDYRTLVDFM